MPHSRILPTLYSSVILIIGLAHADPLTSGEVTYVSGETVYISAGSQDGLQIGQRVEVMRDGEPIATLEVAHTAMHKAACRLVEATLQPVRSDRIRFSRIPSEQEVDSAAPLSIPLDSDSDAPSRSRSHGGWFRENGMRGRVELRLLAVDDRDGADRDFARPVGDIRLQGDHIGGSDWSLDTRVQTRQTYLKTATGGSTTASEIRIYRLAAGWNQVDSPWSITVGRQISGDLPGVSMFDGILTEYRGGLLSAGVFSGTQPEPGGYGYSSDLREHGGFVKLERRVDRVLLWSLTGGVVGSYQKGQIDREYVFVGWRRNRGRLTASISQELDINRGWKRDAGEKIVSITNTYGYGRLLLIDPTSLEAGFDNRRNVRLYRYKETPETQFDDSYRQGYWAGVNQKIGRYSRVSLKGRISTDGAGKTLQSATLTSIASWPSLRSLRFRLRNTVYDNIQGTGWLHSISAGLSIIQGLSLELTQGIRIEQDANSSDDSMQWSEVDLDLGLGRHWSLSNSVEIYRGSGEDHRTYYSGLRYRL